MDVEFGMDRNWKLLDLGALAVRLALAASFCRPPPIVLECGESLENRVCRGATLHTLSYTRND